MNFIYIYIYIYIYINILVIPKEQSGLNVDFILLRVSPLFGGSSGYV